MCARSSWIWSHVERVVACGGAPESVCPRGSGWVATQGYTNHTGKKALVGWQRFVDCEALSIARALEPFAIDSVCHGRIVHDLWLTVGTGITGKSGNYGRPLSSEVFHLWGGLGATHFAAGFFPLPAWFCVVAHGNCCYWLDVRRSLLVLLAREVGYVPDSLMLAILPRLYDASSAGVVRRWAPDTPSR